MKAVLQAAWLLTISFGNLLDVVIVEMKVSDKQVRTWGDERRLLNRAKGQRSPGCVVFLSQQDLDGF